MAIPEVGSMTAMILRKAVAQRERPSTRTRQQFFSLYFCLYSTPVNSPPRTSHSANDHVCECIFFSVFRQPREKAVFCVIIRSIKFRIKSVVFGFCFIRNHRLNWYNKEVTIVGRVTRECTPSPKINNYETIKLSICMFSLSWQTYLDAT